MVCVANITFIIIQTKDNIVYSVVTFNKYHQGSQNVH